MKSINAKTLIQEARKIVGEFALSHANFSAASVGAALVTTKGNLYTGVNFDVACGIGFCAEHSAVAEMLKYRETEIEMIVAVTADSIIPPCGRCREMMFQISEKNNMTKVYLTEDKYVTLNELLPVRWQPSLA